MSDEKRYDEVQRGDMAKLILENPMFNEAMDEMERDTLTAWELSKPLEIEEREALRHFYLACKKFRNTLISKVQTGRMAVEQIEQKKRFSLFRSN